MRGWAARTRSRGIDNNQASYSGRAFHLRDANHPEDVSVTTLTSSLFTQLLTQAQNAAEADRGRLESDAPEASTLALLTRR